MLQGTVSGDECARAPCKAGHPWDLLSRLHTQPWVCRRPITHPVSNSVHHPPTDLYNTVRSPRPPRNPKSVAQKERRGVGSRVQQSEGSRGLRFSLMTASGKLIC